MKVPQDGKPCWPVISLGQIPFFVNKLTQDNADMIRLEHLHPKELYKRKDRQLLSSPNAITISDNFSRSIHPIEYVSIEFRNLSELFLASFLASCFHSGEK